MNIEKFKTAGEWYRKMKKDGFEVPLIISHTFNQING